MSSEIAETAAIATKMPLRHCRHRRQMREHRCHSANSRHCNGVVILVMASDFRLLTDDCRLLTPASMADAVMPMIYGEKSLGIVARVMAWQTVPQKVRACDKTATIRPSKCGHKTTTRDAHYVAGHSSDDSRSERLTIDYRLLTFPQLNTTYCLRNFTTA